MKYVTALKHYKTHAAMAKAAGVKKQAVTYWKRLERIPERPAYRLAAASGGRLKVNAKDYEPKERGRRTGPAEHPADKDRGAPAAGQVAIRDR